MHLPPPFGQLYYLSCFAVWISIPKAVGSQGGVLPEAGEEFIQEHSSCLISIKVNRVG